LESSHRNLVAKTPRGRACPGHPRLRMHKPRQERRGCPEQVRARGYVRSPRMKLMSWSAMLAPFEVRSFRFQFPADLLTSWGMEMENLVLGWYILVATGSVLALTLYWALQYLGTLLAPAFGMAGDRVGQRAIIAAMRAFYAVLAAAVTALAFAGALDPMYVFIIAA